MQGKRLDSEIPVYASFVTPVLHALHDLGGSGSSADIDAKALQLAGLTMAQLDLRQNRYLSKAVYRIHWARSYLKAYGLLQNPRRGWWILTDRGRKTPTVDGKEVIRVVRSLRRQG